MFDFTRQERQVILFLICLVLLGLGINFAVKINSRAEKFVKLNEDIIRIDINQAGYEDLVYVEGISPGLAKSIIDYRNEYGPFRDLEELKQVKGIGEFRYERMKDQLILE